jgi:hypothetical protein
MEERSPAREASLWRFTIENYNIEKIGNDIIDKTAFHL